MSEKSCASCRFWSGAEWSGQPNQPNFGECRRHAPRFCYGSLFHFTDERRNEAFATSAEEVERAIWPETAKHEWCGEWEPIQLEVRRADQ